VVTPEEINEFWTPIEPDDYLEGWCQGRQKASFSVWQFRLSDLPPGDYELHFKGWITHPVTDGVDYAGDGTPDVVPPEDYGGETVNYITVLEP
jgi:hypothetical protein